MKDAQRCFKTARWPSRGRKDTEVWRITVSIFLWVYFRLAGGVHGDSSLWLMCDFCRIQTFFCSPPTCSQHSHSQVISSFFLLFVLFACFLPAGPPAGKQAIVFSWPVSIGATVCVREFACLQFAARPAPIVVCDIILVCVCLWWCYLCSDKTVNQINLAWKSLSAGPLCVHVCVFVNMCVVPLTSLHLSQPIRWATGSHIVCVCTHVCVCVCRKSTENAV